MFFMKKKKEAKKVTESNVKEIPKENKVKRVSKESKEEKVTKKDSKEKSNVKFTSSNDIEAYYELENAKIRSSLEEMEREKAGAYLEVVQNKLMRLRVKKKKIDWLEEDLKGHLDKLNAKINSLNRQRQREGTREVKIKLLTDSISSLEGESKKILETKKRLLQKENFLVQQMKELANVAPQKFKLTHEETNIRLKEIEFNKEQIIEKARELLSEESAKMFLDIPLLVNAKRDVSKKIDGLNKELEKVQMSKKRILAKKQLLDISEEKATKEIENVEKQIQALEEKYRKLLGKK